MSEIKKKKKKERKRNLGLKKNSCARKCPTSQTQWVWTQQEKPQCLYFCVSSIFSAPFCSSSISYAAPWTTRQEVRVRVREGNKIQEMCCWTLDLDFEGDKKLREFEASY